MKKLKNILGSLIVAFAINSNSLYSDESPKTPPSFVEELKFEPRLRTSIRYCNLYLKETKDLELPSEETEPLSRQKKIALKAGNGLDMLPIRGGYSASYDLKGVHLFGGVDAELNWGKFRDIRDESGNEIFFEVDGKNSGVYDRVYRDALGLYPFLGIRLRSAKRYFEVEYSLPLHKFRREWGQIIEGDQRKIGSERYLPRGFGLTLKHAVWGHERRWRSGVEIGIEQYRLKGDEGVMGRIKSCEIGFFFERKF